LAVPPPFGCREFVFKIRGIDCMSPVPGSSGGAQETDRRQVVLLVDNVSKEEEKVVRERAFKRFQLERRGQSAERYQGNVPQTDPENPWRLPANDRFHCDQSNELAMANFSSFLEYWEAFEAARAYTVRGNIIKSGITLTPKDNGSGTTKATDLMFLFHCLPKIALVPEWFIDLVLKNFAFLLIEKFRGAVSITQDADGSAPAEEPATEDMEALMRKQAEERQKAEAAASKNGGAAASTNSGSDFLLTNDNALPILTKNPPFPLDRSTVTQFSQFEDRRQDPLNGFYSFLKRRLRESVKPERPTVLPDIDEAFAADKGNNPLAKSATSAVYRPLYDLLERRLTLANAVAGAKVRPGVDWTYPPGEIETERGPAEWGEVCGIDLDQGTVDVEWVRPAGWVSRERRMKKQGYSCGRGGRYDLALA